MEKGKEKTTSMTFRLPFSTADKVKDIVKTVRENETTVGTSPTTTQATVVNDALAMYFKKYDKAVK